MIEIDFIPQWYRAGRNRRLWYQRQALILGVVAVLVALWCFIAGRGLSRTRAELTAAHSDFESEVTKIQRCEELQARYSELLARTKILESIIPRTSYATVLAELSHCIGRDSVIKKLDIYSEPLEFGRNAVSAGNAGKTVRRGSSFAANKTKDRPSATQTCIDLVGYAADAKQVAALISSLEQSSYFFHVAPVYSKNETVRGCEVTEFEIRCVVADFEFVSGKEQAGDAIR